MVAAAELTVKCADVVLNLLYGTCVARVHGALHLRFQGFDIATQANIPLPYALMVHIHTFNQWTRGGIKWTED